MPYDTITMFKFTQELLSSLLVKCFVLLYHINFVK